MHNVVKFPVIYFTLCFMSGVVLADKLLPKIPFILIVCIILLFILFVSYKVLHQNTLGKVLFRITSKLCAIAAGALVFCLHYPPNHQNHYSNNIAVDQDALLKGTISEVLRPNPYSFKYYLEIETIDSVAAKGKLLVNFSKKNPEPPLDVGDEIYANCKIKALIKPNNPFQFNYADYLEKKDVFHQIYLENSNFKVVDINKNSNYHIDIFRKDIINGLKKYEIPETEMNIIKALLLGQRQDIHENTLQEFSKSGAIHILAISGLHIGILMMFFRTLLSPLKSIKNGRIIQLILLIAILWGYALVAGMSASVVRAVTMFSFVSVGLYYRRTRDIYNSMAASILILLCFKPNFLFDVGFQLSYSAVVAIVWIMPVFSSWWKPKNKIVKYFYDVIAVSCAAQLGVLPSSIYYFHQFPGLFLLTNILIIPLLTAILVLGISVILIYLMGITFVFPAKILSFLTKIMCDYVAFIASYDQFIIAEIPFNLYLLIASFILIVAVVLWLKKTTAKRFFGVLFSVILLQLTFFGTKYYHSKKNEAIIFQYPKRTIIAVKHENKVSVYTNDSLINRNYVLKNYLQGSFSSLENIENLSDSYNFNNKTLLIIDKRGFYNLNEKPDIVLITQSPKINFERMILTLNPKQIIADGSNFSNYTEIWREYCKKHNIPLHITNEDGYYRIKL